MMRILQRIFDDLKRGENIDLYVTIVVALALAALNLLGVTPQNWLSSLTLAVLALLISAILGIRERLQVIQTQLDQTAENDILEDFPDELDFALERATEIWILGVHLSGVIRHDRPLLESKLRSGGIIRVLLVNPNSAACAMAAARNPGKLFVEREKTLIMASLNNLCELKNIAPEKLEIRVIDDPLPYGGYMLNPDKLDGAIFLKKFSYKIGLRPRFVYHRRNRHWFDFIKSEIEALWSNGTEWPCDEWLGSSSEESAA